jgi:hypothetical protein
MLVASSVEAIISAVRLTRMSGDITTDDADNTGGFRCGAQPVSSMPPNNNAKGNIAKDITPRLDLA